MDQFLRRLTETKLVDAIEMNRYALADLACERPGAEAYSDGTVSWYVTDIAFAACNVAFATRLPQERADEAIARFMSRGRARGVPLQWWLGPGSQPTDLPGRLTAHGFSHAWDTAGMALDLRNGFKEVAFPPEFAIERVEDPLSMKTWAEVATAGFGFPPAASPALLSWFTALQNLRGTLFFYLGRYRGQPVATSLAFAAEGVVGLYFVATLPEARQRGFGSALTQKPLQAARAMGYPAAILHASEMGYPLYRRMGFKEYCKIEVYIWQPDAP